jgi:hypothetical protein
MSLWQPFTHFGKGNLVRLVALRLFWLGLVPLWKLERNPNLQHCMMNAVATLLVQPVSSSSVE